MNIKRLRALRDITMQAIVHSETIEIPEWRFDGKAITTAEEVALTVGITIDEARTRLEMKDVYSGSGAGVTTHGIGTRLLRQRISQRAHALAYGKRRRRRRHKRREQ